MAKLAKPAEHRHREACRLVDLRRPLTEDEKYFVLDHYRESANPRQNRDGVFFTPGTLARDMALSVSGQRVIDLCAGIGRLAFHLRSTIWEERNNEPARTLVCVERNPEYVRVGRRVLPEARWVNADVLGLTPKRHQPFDTAVANPPFGVRPCPADTFGYRGRKFEYHVIAAASRMARAGVFLIPQMSAPFRISGRSGHEPDPHNTGYQRFTRQTGLEITTTLAIDTTHYDEDWHHPPPLLEIVACDFTAVPASVMDFASGAAA